MTTSINFNYLDLPEISQTGYDVAVYILAKRLNVEQSYGNMFNKIISDPELAEKKLSVAELMNKQLDALFHLPSAKEVVKCGLKLKPGCPLEDAFVCISDLLFKTSTIFHWSKHPETVKHSWSRLIGVYFVLVMLIKRKAVENRKKFGDRNAYIDHCLKLVDEGAEVMGKYVNRNPLYSWISQKDSDWSDFLRVYRNYL